MAFLSLQAVDMVLKGAFITPRGAGAALHGLPAL
jgi:hypothetical protein